MLKHIIIIIFTDLNDTFAYNTKTNPIIVIYICTYLCITCTIFEQEKVAQNILLNIF